MKSASCIIQADKRYRKKLLTVHLIVLLLGAAVWKWVFPPLHQLYKLPNKERTEAIEIISHSVLLLFIPGATYLIGVGRKVCRYKAMQYPEMRVFRDTVFITKSPNLDSMRYIPLFKVPIGIVTSTSPFAEGNFHANTTFPSSEKTDT